MGHRHLLCRPRGRAESEGSTQVSVSHVPCLNGVQIRTQWKLVIKNTLRPHLHVSGYLYKRYFSMRLQLVYTKTIDVCVYRVST